jgi:hypothetical protein
MATHSARALALVVGSWGKGMHDLPVCNPGGVAAGARCAYVRAHAADCWPDGGLQRLLEYHECFFGPAW